jgi:hypothetical protein
MSKRSSVLLAWAIFAGPSSVLAQSPSLEISPDTTASFNGTVLRPGEVGRDDLAGVVSFTGTGVVLPVGVNLEGLERLSGANSSLISTDVSAALPSGFLAQPGDVVRVSSGVPSVAWSSRAVGLNVEGGLGVDAVAEYPDGDLLLSFDTTVSFGGILAFDEDLVRVDLPAGTPSLVFDGSERGVASGLDLDAADVQADGRLLISFDGGGRIGPVEFRDEDVLVYDSILQSLSVSTAYDGSARYAAWDAADLDAIDSAGPLIADGDGDAIADLDDLCPFWVQIDNLDTDLDRRGNECECTDQSGDGRNTVTDLVAINLAIFGSVPVSPLCDGNNDGLCNVSDIVAANIEIFSPTSTSTCVRQPFPGP